MRCSCLAVTVTVMDTVRVLAGSGRPVGVLPGGTGNLLAGALGIPRSVPRAAHALLAGRVRRLDLGRLSSGESFAFAAGLGVDADMIAGTSARRKLRWGVFGYALTAAQCAWRLDRFALTVEVDGSAVRTRATLAMVVNAGSLFGGVMEIGPGIVPDDGLLDVCLFSPDSRRDVLTLTGRALSKRIHAHSRVQYLRGRHIRIETEPSRAVQADGELVGQTPLEVTVDPGAATFLVP